MSWASVGQAILKTAPLLGNALASPIGAVVSAASAIVSSALGLDNDATTIDSALKANPELLLKLKQSELDNALQLQKLTLENATAQLAQINETMRSEIASNDSYVRRWRPTFGYSVCFTWNLTFVTMCVMVVYVVIGEPTHADMVLNEIAQLMGSLTVMWGIALAVLGINVSARSKDKMTEKGLPVPSLLQKVGGLIHGDKG